jgi:stearoyl-CoA desaturase (delta-9 desaturase)
VVWVGWSWAAVGVAAALYALRMFVITAFYHRYFSHRTFQTSRAAQFVFAFIGASSAQRGPLWWAAHHREHHRESDLPPDPHSPRQKGVVWSHMGWFLSDSGVRTDLTQVPDLVKYPELVWLNRHHVVPVVALAVGCFALGSLLGAVAPWLGTNGWQMLVWGFFISTTVLHHATFTINSIAHKVGSQRYRTHDDSRNNWVLALLTFGEGWHNNHHFNPGSVRQGFYWWEIDLAYYGLLALERVGVVWKLRPVPERVYDSPHMIRRGDGGAKP